MFLKQNCAGRWGCFSKLFCGRKSLMYNYRGVSNGKMSTKKMSRVRHFVCHFCVKFGVEGNDGRRSFHNLRPVQLRIFELCLRAVSKIRCARLILIITSHLNAYTNTSNLHILESQRSINIFHYFIFQIFTFSFFILCHIFRGLLRYP